jgi:hypothetical protein
MHGTVLRAVRCHKRPECVRPPHTPTMSPSIVQKQRLYRLGRIVGRGLRPLTGILSQNSGPSRAIRASPAKPVLECVSAHVSDS